MKTEDYLNLVNGKKGQFIKLEWTRAVSLAAQFKNLIVTKNTQTVVRTGIIYDNLQSVIEKRENGELPEKNEGLSWGNWKNYPFVITHKEIDYARLYSAPNQKPTVTWYLNGAKVSKDVIIPFMTPSDAKRELNRTSAFECFTVKMEDLKITDGL